METAGLEKFLDEIFSGDLEMIRYFGKDSPQGSDTQGSVIWNGQVVFSVFTRGQAHMAACLTRLLNRRFENTPSGEQ